MADDAWIEWEREQREEASRANSERVRRMRDDDKIIHPATYRAYCGRCDEESPSDTEEDWGGWTGLARGCDPVLLACSFVFLGAMAMAAIFALLGLL